MGLASFMERASAMWHDRWLGLVFGMWMQGCGGISYTFGLYSAALKSRLQYNQEMTDGLGTSKDIGGNVGIVSGLLIDFMPAWAVLAIGGCMHLGGYSMLYLAANGYAHPPFWQMCLFIMLGTNGATWFNTAVLVVCMRNFQGDRGVVVGLLKGFIGLSGAIFTQVYSAVYAPETGPFLLVCTVVPPVMAFVSMLVIRPRDPEPNPNEAADAARFRFLYIACVSLALYLMAVIILQEVFPVQAFTRKFFMTVMLIVLVLPIAVPWQAAKERSANAKGALNLQTGSALLPSSSSSSSSSAPLIGRAASGEDSEQGAQLRGSSGLSERIPPSPRGQNPGPSPPVLPTTSSFNASATAGGLQLGMDHTLFQAFRTSDYWILFFSMGCGAGSGLTAINNLGQMAEALGSKSVGSFVALVSVWNFLGRMGAGYISEHYMKRYSTPRPVFMMAVQAAMGCAHLLFATGVPILLYVGSAMVGMSHGAQWTCMVAIASELFGLQHFGAMYNTLTISATIGSYLLSVKLAGYMYDREVEKERVRLLLEGVQLTALPHKCTGAKCFRNTFLVMSAVCFVGVTALFQLVARTRRLYQKMHKGHAER